jgi:hypothetical protein
MQMLLALKFHSITTSWLLLEFEHVGVKAKIAQQAVSELFELTEHLVLFFGLLSRDATWKGRKSSTT